MTGLGDDLDDLGDDLDDLGDDLDDLGDDLDDLDDNLGDLGDNLGDLGDVLDDLGNDLDDLGNDLDDLGDGLGGGLDDLKRIAPIYSLSPWTPQSSVWSMGTPFSVKALPTGLRRLQDNQDHAFTQELRRRCTPTSFFHFIPQLPTAKSRSGSLQKMTTTSTTRPSKLFPRFETVLASSLSASQAE
ncbi:hypothetical protein BGX31_010415 [Mortierella sp. GBA43]|nr:hypothetical protein BGX31_010415 [Mortierella sp. GBA43]